MLIIFCADKKYACAKNRKFRTQVYSWNVLAVHQLLCIISSMLVNLPQSAHYAARYKRAQVVLELLTVFIMTTVPVTVIPCRQTSLQLGGCVRAISGHDH